MPPVPDDMTVAKLVRTTADALAFLQSPAWGRITQRRAELIHLANNPNAPGSEALDEKELSELNKQSRRIVYLAYPPPTDSAMVEMMLRYEEGKGIR